MQNQKEDMHNQNEEVDFKGVVMPGQIGAKDLTTAEEIIKKLECVD